MDEISRLGRKHPLLGSVGAITLAAVAIVVVDLQVFGFALFAVLSAVGVLTMAHRRIARRQVASPGPYPKPAGMVVSAVTGAALAYGMRETWRAAVMGAFAMCALIWVMHVGYRAVGPDFRLRLRSLPDRNAPEDAALPDDLAGSRDVHTERDDPSVGPVIGAVAAAIIAVTLTFAKRWDNALLALAVIWAVALVVPPSGAYVSRRYRRRHST